VYNLCKKNRKKDMNIKERLFGGEPMRNEKDTEDDEG
jgi:hypothetical protein